MADTKISALTAATTPLAGTEVLPIVQSGVTKQVSVADLTAGRAVSALSLTATTSALIGTVTAQGTFDVGIQGSLTYQYLTGGTGNNATTGVFKIGSGVGRGASVQGYRGASSNVHNLDLYSYNSADVHVMRMESGGDAKVMTGNLVIGTSGKGIDFSVTSEGTGTMTSELFSDYEEGTFTPTIASGATSISYTTQSGYYTKIGRVVQFQINLNISTSTLDGNQLKLGGLPFTCGADFGGAYMVGANSSFENVTTAPRALWRIASSGTTVDAFYTNNTTYKGTDMSGVNPVIRVVGSYIV